MPYKNISNQMPKCPKCKEIAIPLGKKEDISIKGKVIASRTDEMGYTRAKKFLYIDVFCPQCMQAFRWAQEKR